MKLFNNAENYRNELSTDLKNIREGNIIDKGKDFFLSEETKKERMIERHKKSQEFLSTKSFTSEYENSKNITHPEILEKIEKERAQWVENYKQRSEQEKIHNVENFKNEYNNFEQFLNNKDFNFIVENGSEIRLVKKDSDEYKNIINSEPYRNEYGFQCAYISSNGEGIKILTENDTVDVLPKIYKENDIADGQPQTESTDGEKVQQVIEQLGLNENIAIVTYPDNNYENNSLKIEYGAGSSQNLTPFLEKLDPEFFKGGGRYVGGGYKNQIFENIDGKRKIIPVDDLGDFIKKDTILYLCEQ